MSPSPSTQASALAPRALGDRDLPVLLQRAAEPVVVESHYAGWDRPWRGLSEADWRELFRALGERVNGAVIETGASRELAARYALEIIPTVLVFSGGEVVARFTGATRVADVVAAVRSALERAQALESDRRELAAAGERAALAPVRSILRQRVGEPALARAAG